MFTVNKNLYWLKPVIKQNRKLLFPNNLIGTKTDKTIKVPIPDFSDNFYIF